MLTDLVDETVKTQSNPSFYIRDVPIYGDTILAPMDGYSDWTSVRFAGSSALP